jgi:hypothetical protein
MNPLIPKILRRHISTTQLTGFFLANLAGMLIILLSIQLYRDIAPIITGGDSFMKEDYIIAGKKVSTLGAIGGKSNTFSATEINQLGKQSFTRSVAPFTATQFSVAGAFTIEGTGLQLSTAMFFESVPDKYVDIKLDKWHFDPADPAIPIIIPRNYLNLYNFGFSQSRNLPQLSEGLAELIKIDIILRGNAQQKQYKGSIAGFSDRLNTILVPQTFMDWANNTFAPHAQAAPSRLIVEVENPADPAVATYFQQKGYETEDGKLNAGQTARFLRLIVAIVLAVGLLISALSFYILILSIYLLLQKNTTQLESLLLIGYSPRQTALPFQLLAVGLNAAVFILSAGLLSLLRPLCTRPLSLLYPQPEASTILPTLCIGAILFAAISWVNSLLIRKKVNRLFPGN